MVNTNNTSFGFEDIPTEEKVARVRGVFDRVASKYDVMNDVMSGGLHRLWKDAMVARACPQPAEVIIDMAGGTGDIAHRLHDRVERTRIRRGGDEAKIHICDINHDMLYAGLKQDAGSPYADMPRLQMNAEHLCFPDNFANLYTIAFGIRNVTHRSRALAEAFRILRPGGRFVCLEFSHIHPSIRPVYDAYSFGFVPKAGKIITGDAAPYQYLVESIRRFPNAMAFEAEIKTAGFINVAHRKLTAGVVALHWGQKPR